jgi:hypothetical protein
MESGIHRIKEGARESRDFDIPIDTALDNELKNVVLDIKYIRDASNDQQKDQQKDEKKLSFDRRGTTMHKSPTHKLKTLAQVQDGHRTFKKIDRRRSFFPSDIARVSNHTAKDLMIQSYQDSYKVSGIRIDKRFIEHISRLITIFSVLIFSFYMITREPIGREIWVSLISSLFGFMTGKSQSYSDKKNNDDIASEHKK